MVPAVNGLCNTNYLAIFINGISNTIRGTAESAEVDYGRRAKTDGICLLEIIRNRTDNLTIIIDCPGNAGIPSREISKI